MKVIRGNKSPSRPHNNYYIDRFYQATEAMSIRSQVLALTSPALDANRALRQRCVAEAREAVIEGGCEELAKVAIDVGEFAA